MDTQPENIPSKDATGGRTKGEPAARKDARPVIAVDSPIFKDVRVTLDAALGRAELSVHDMLALKSGSVVKLDAQLNDLVELRLNDSLVARGEIVTVDGNFAVRIVEIAQLT